jgi:small multidrug resistance pump
MKWFLILFGIIANATASTLVKTMAPSPTLMGTLLDWRLIVSLGCYGLAFLAYAAAVARMPLNIAHPVSTAGAIVLVGMLSWLVFNENFSAMRIAGYGLLLVGIAVLATPG